MNKNLNKISAWLKNPLYRLGVIAFLFLFIWMIIIILGKNQIRMGKLKFKELNSNISQIQNMIGASQSVEKGRELLKNKLNLLNSKFPSKEDAALQALSELAKFFDLNISSIKFNSKETYLTKGGQSKIIDGKECKLLNVFIILEGSYQDFFQLIYKMPGSLPVLIKIEHFTMHKSALHPKWLDITLELKLYLLV